jgi:hypothetical protein
MVFTRHQHIPLARQVMQRVGAQLVWLICDASETLTSFEVTTATPPLSLVDFLLCCVFPEMPATGPATVPP